jgi:hypothetical protein
MEVVAAPQSSEVQTTISQITSLRHEDLGSELFVLATNFLLYIALVRASPLFLTRIIYPGGVIPRFSRYTCLSAAGELSFLFFPAPALCHTWQVILTILMQRIYFPHTMPDHSTASHLLDPHDEATAAVSRRFYIRAAPRVGEVKPWSQATVQSLSLAAALFLGATIGYDTVRFPKPNVSLSLCLRRSTASRRAPT